MSLQPQYSPADLDRYIAEQIERRKRMMIRDLAYIGEMAVSHARNLPSPSAASFPTYPKIPPHQPNYIDWTSNLRSSIGYVIMAEGRQAGKGGFQAVGAGSDGASRGEQTALKAAAGFPGKIVLIVAAGMHYAAYVADKGYDVLDSAELIARKLIRQLADKYSNR